MPWKELLSSVQRAHVLALPTTLREYEELYTLTPADLQFVAKRRTDPNRLGIAVQLCFLRHPGRVWVPDEVMPEAMVRFIAHQVDVDSTVLADYAGRDETRREHLAELIREYGYTTLDIRNYRLLSAWLIDQARVTDNGLALVMLLVDEVRRRRIVVPALAVVERMTLSARARARQEAYTVLTTDLTLDQRAKLNSLLDARPESRQTYLGWVRQSLGAASPTNILSCIERLIFLREFGVPPSWATRLHQNRLVQIAREGANTDSTHLKTFAADRRYATLVACVLDTMMTLIDEALEMHERFLGQQFKKAERKHLTIFQQNGKAINDTLKRYTTLGRALLAAKAANTDPFIEIEKVLSWADLTTSVSQAE